MVWIIEKIGLVILLTGVKDHGSISRTFLEQFVPVGNQYLLPGFAYDVSTGQKKPNNQNDFASEGKQSWLLQFACQPQLISSGLRRNNIVQYIIPVIKMQEMLSHEREAPLYLFLFP